MTRRTWRNALCVQHSTLVVDLPVKLFSMTIAVLGAGMVGRAIALDLGHDHAVTSFDLDATNLEKLRSEDRGLQTVAADLTHFDEYKNFLTPFDIVVTAVPGFMGYQTLEAVINAGK